LSPFLPILEENLPMARAELYKGDANEDVTHLQTLLGINADGIFGDQTEAAVVEFQTKHGLAADGIVGAGTWGALETETKQSSSGTSFGQLLGGLGGNANSPG
jgi:peptidoglycan hydrolase-like protein with peptidoglycan-binding domain